MITIIRKIIITGRVARCPALIGSRVLQLSYLEGGYRAKRTRRVNSGFFRFPSTDKRRGCIFELWTIGTTEMPLTRGEVLRFDPDRMAFEFTMLDSEGATVRCQISGAAMDELAGTRGTASAERQAQFMSLRDRIERIASEKFDGGGVFKGAVVRIFVKHIATALHPAKVTNADPDNLASKASASD
jgi:Protein of unknown function (DUF1488)